MLSHVWDVQVSRFTTQVRIITDVAYLVLYLQSVSWWLKLWHSNKKFSQVTNHSVRILLNSPVWGCLEMLQIATFREILCKTETGESRSQHTHVTYQLLQSVLVTCSTLPHTTSLINSCTWWLCGVYRKDSLALIYCFACAEALMIFCGIVKIHAYTKPLLGVANGVDWQAVLPLVYTHSFT